MPDSRPAQQMLEARLHRNAGHYLVFTCRCGNVAATWTFMVACAEDVPSCCGREMDVVRAGRIGGAS